MKKQIEVRRIKAGELRAQSADGKTTIGGYAAVFDSPSVDMGWTEEIDPQAFDSVLAASPDVRCLFNHDPGVLLGRTTAGTLRLGVDARGLSYECDLPDTQAGRDIATLIQRRDISGSSFGFICKRDQWTDNRDGTITRRILEFDQLLDVSPVTYPAYTATSAGKRSLPTSMPAELRSKFSKRDWMDGDGEDANPDTGCTCQCPECVDGDCADCSHDGCQCTGCTCPSATGGDEYDSTRSRMEMELELAQRA